MSAATGRLKPGILATLFLGLAVAAYLIHYIGVEAVLQAALAIGWGGFALFCVLGLANYCLLGAAWFALAPDWAPRRLAVFIWGRMIRDSASEILPLSQVGGFVIGARAIVLRGVSGAMATASTIADITMEMLAQIVFILLGIALLATVVAQTQFTSRLTTVMTVGLLLGAVAGLAFLIVQRKGTAAMERQVSRFLPKAWGRTAELATAMNAIHRSTARLALSFALHLLSWIANAVVTLIAMRLMGAHISLGAVLALESILYGVRSAAFFMPSALGVQELTYATLGPLFGLPPAVAIAISLLKRARDITIGVPVLLIWQAEENAHQIFARKGRANQPTDE